jgi:hypothetical protein
MHTLCPGVTPKLTPAKTWCNPNAMDTFLSSMYGPQLSRAMAASCFALRIAETPEGKWALTFEMAELHSFGLNHNVGRVALAVN